MSDVQWTNFWVVNPSWLQNCEPINLLCSNLPGNQYILIQKCQRKQSIFTYKNEKESKITWFITIKTRKLLPENLALYHQNVRLVFSSYFDVHGYPTNAKEEKPTRKTCFSREMKCLALRIYPEKFCLVAFLWSQRNFYCNLMRKRCWNRGEYLKSFKNESLNVK